MPTTDILFSLFSSFRLGNYINFFRTVAADASYLQYCIMEPYINEVITVTIDCILFLISCLLIFFGYLYYACLVGCMLHLAFYLFFFYNLFICIVLSSNETSFVITIAIIKNSHLVLSSLALLMMSITLNIY
jgi:hypothetical protein